MFIQVTETPVNEKSHNGSGVTRRDINRLRRLAKKYGLRFFKSTWRRDSPDNLGGYQLIDAMSNTVIDGDRFDMTVADVERRLAALTQNGGVA